MRNSLLSLLFLLSFCYTHLYAQAPIIEWQKCYGGTKDEEANSIQLTHDGGYIIAGSAKSSNGDVTGIHGSYDYWVVKIDSVGEIKWEKCLGGTKEDVAHSVKQTTDGGFIVAGYSSSSNGDVSAHIEFNDYWIVKLDTIGNIQWEKSLGGTLDDIAYSIIQSSDGGYVIAGSSTSIDGDITSPLGTSDYWVVKLNSFGDMLWQKSYGGSGWDVANSIQQTNDGGYIVGGSTYSNDGNVTEQHDSMGRADYWIIKLDSSGNLQWQQALGGTEDENAYDVEQTFDGGYIINGESTSNDGDVTNHHGDVGSGSPQDYWVVKLNSSGNIEWQKSIGGTGVDWGKSVRQTADSGFIVSGYSTSSDDDATFNHGASDYWIVKLDDSGNIKWEHSYGGSSIDVCGYGEMLQIANDGGYIVAGGTNSNDGDVSGLHDFYRDFWIVKLSKCIIPSIIYDSGQLCAETAASYQWYLNGIAINGATDQCYLPIESGPYSVQLIDSTICFEISEDYYFVATAVQNLQEVFIALFPNPTASNLTIRSSASINGFILIEDLYGRIVYTEPIQNLSNKSLDVSFLNSGMYWLEIRYSGKVEKRKFIKTEE